MVPYPLQRMKLMPILSRPVGSEFFGVDKLLYIMYIYSMHDESKPKIALAPLTSAGEGPLYRQIVDAVKRELSEGRLDPGAPLPSFRALAEDLLVSVITVKRAYEELEKEGILFRKQGLGTFVSENGAVRSREIQRGQAEELLRRALREGQEAGLSAKDLEATVKRILKEES